MTIIEGPHYFKVGERVAATEESPFETGVQGVVTHIVEFPKQYAVEWDGLEIPTFERGQDIEKADE